LHRKEDEPMNPLQKRGVTELKKAVKAAEKKKAKTPKTMKAENLVEIRIIEEDDDVIIEMDDEVKGWSK
jgi:hypothetical protein